MKKHFTFIIMLISASLLKSQSSVGLSGGVFQLHSPSTNHTIDVFNFTRIWLDEKLPKPNQGFGGQLVVNRKLNHWLDFTSAMGYQFFESEIAQPEILLDTRFDLVQLMLGIRFRPFSFNVMDSAGLKHEPFVGIAIGGFGNSATVNRFNEAAEVNYKPYRSINGGFATQLTIGYLFQISKRCVIAPQYQLSFLPNMHWKNYDLALHGTSQPNLYNKSSSWLNALQVSITWKINKALPADSEE
jgi:hypothetical protein